MKNDTFLPEEAEGGIFPTTENAADTPPPESHEDIDREEIEALCADLADAMLNPHGGSFMLRRQAQLLDHLLYTVANGRLQNAVDRGYLSDDWIGLILKIQKQCVDTVKAENAVEYMKAIAPRQHIPLPPSADREEQTIKET